MILGQLINVAVNGLYQRGECRVIPMKASGLNISRHEIDCLLTSQVAEPMTAQAVGNGEEASALVEPKSVLVASPQIALMRHSSSLHGLFYDQADLGRDLSASNKLAG
jgi:hypothetical protein